jgi:hypothetical protein
MLDNIEQYKTQQLERLRENYTQQVEESPQYRNLSNKKMGYCVYMHVWLYMHVFVSF